VPVPVRKVLGDSMSSQTADTIRGVIEALGRRTEQAERERDDLVAVLDDFLTFRTEAAYRARMQDGSCHAGICTIDECGRCRREMAVLRALEKARKG
jgi:hypothetical protein